MRLKLYLMIVFGIIKILYFHGVDKISARKYIDNKCTFYNKFFIDSGTQGINANCIYSKRNNMFKWCKLFKKKEILSCTLKNIPTVIYNCIEW